MIGNEKDDLFPLWFIPLRPRGVWGCKQALQCDIVVDTAFFRQSKKAHTHISWSSWVNFTIPISVVGTTQQVQARRFLEGIDNLTWVTEQLTRGTLRTDNSYSQGRTGQGSLSPQKAERLEQLSYEEKLKKLGLFSLKKAQRVISLMSADEWDGKG